MHDYLWRWDTDWFWCSKNLLVQNPIVRRLVGKSRLNSVTYTKVMRWNSRWQLTRRLDRLLGIQSESVIQDVDIPIANAPAFLEFFQREIGIEPIWICPIHARNSMGQFDLYRMDPGTVYVNFGFWDVVASWQKLPAGHYNRQVGAEGARAGRNQIAVFRRYSEEAFWRAYGGEAYARLKQHYDPQGRFGDLYQKCVLRA